MALMKMCAHRLYRMAILRESFDLPDMPRCSVLDCPWVVVPAHVTIRGDSHYARPEVMDFCDANGIDYVFGLPLRQ
jgi:hypothetical protein